VQKTAEEVRRQPVKSLVWAFFVGIFLTVFPVGRIIGLVVGTVFALLRPVLLLLGLMKASEVLSENCCKRK
jgi:RsiW-degrading membrane proteinase PrsW (M82 family)